MGDKYHKTGGLFWFPDLVLMYQKQILEVAHLMIFIGTFWRARNYEDTDLCFHHLFLPPFICSLGCFVIHQVMY